MWLELAGPGQWKGYWTLTGAITAHKELARRFKSHRDAQVFIDQYSREHDAPISARIEPASVN